MISYLTRPLSLSVRLFANMMAGHTMLKVFGAFVVGARLSRRLGAARLHGGVHRARNSGRVPAGLCVRDPDLHLSQRRASHASLGLTLTINVRKERRHGSSSSKNDRRGHRLDRARRRRRRHRHDLRQLPARRLAQSSAAPSQFANSCSASRWPKPPACSASSSR